MARPRQKHTPKGRSKNPQDAPTIEEVWKIMDKVSVDLSKRVIDIRRGRYVANSRSS